VIPGDIATALGVRASGTWRPAPPGSGGGPGTYATSLPFLLAGAAGAEPAEVAAGLAARLRREAWIAGAAVTGGGYLTVTVTDRALAELAVRVPAAGVACAASDALGGTELAVPEAADPASAGSWDEAAKLVTAAVTGRLAEACGAKVSLDGCPERKANPGQGGPAAAVAFAGADAVRYALASVAPGRAGEIEASRYVREDLGNPFFLVRYAHARAASVLRWAADLDVDRGAADAFRPGLLSHRGELELLGAISWLPERVAAAARRRRPDVLVRHMECLASRWLDCAERYPALPFGGRLAPRDGAEAAARLWLAVAAQTAMGTGLGLLGVTAPQRL
jgi:arginyl-tRNA synthetase